MAIPIRIVGLLYCIGLFLFPGCARSGGEHSSDAETLIVLPGAELISRRSDGASQQVNYKIEAAYPPNQVLEALEHQLRSHAWASVAQDVLNPQRGRDTLDRWDDIEDRTLHPPMMVRQRISQWSKSDGAVAIYGFRYMYPVAGKPELHTLYVHATYWPANVVKTIQTAIPKAMQENPPQ